MVGVDAASNPSSGVFEWASGICVTGPPASCNHGRLAIFDELRVTCNQANLASSETGHDKIVAQLQRGASIRSNGKRLLGDDRYQEVADFDVLFLVLGHPDKLAAAKIYPGGGVRQKSAQVSFTV